MSVLPTPPAARLRPARWRDLRLVVGVLLVLTSVAVGARVVSSADDGVPVWAAARPLGPGQSVTVADLQQVTVRLAEPSRYLSARARPPVGYQVVRAVGQGELLPAAALAAPERAAARRVVVDVPSSEADGLRPGQPVDVYVVEGAGPAAGQAPAQGAAEVTPRVVVEAVTVAGLGGGGGFGATGASRGVALYVDARQVPAVLAATVRGAVHLVARVGADPTAGGRAR